MAPGELGADAPTKLFNLVLLFHNLKGYDSHHVVKCFKRKYTERISANGKKTYDDVKVIAQTTEKFITFSIENLVFVDSFAFLSSSLQSLVAILLKGGKEKFEHTAEHFKTSESVYQKGVFPYNYVTDDDKLNRTSLPEIEAFYDDLNDEPCAPVDYQRAKDAWVEFGMTDMREYQNHYLTTDVLLLADVFENFRQGIYREREHPAAR